MNNKILLILVVFLFSCSLSLPIIPNDNDKKINIDYDYYYLNDSNLLFDISYSIPYKELIFIKEADGFYSNITCSIRLENKDGDILYSNSWMDSIYLEYFEETTTSNKYLSYYSLSIDNKKIHQNGDAADYILHIEINDYPNHKYWNNNIILSIKEPEILSDLNFFIKNNNEYVKMENFKNDDIEDIDTIWVKYQIIDDNIDSSGIKFEIKQNSLDSKEQYLTLTIDKENIQTYKINLLPIPLKDIYSGEIIANCYYKNIKKQAFVSLLNDNSIEYDYEILFGPMEYILDEREYIDYITLKREEKMNYVLQYWENINDPSLLNEFYSRIEYSNLKFRNILGDGFKSDKGKIYIIYGKPFNIENRINQNGDYQEIWIYRNKKFIFINKYGYYECYNC